MQVYEMIQTEKHCRPSGDVEVSAGTIEAKANSVVKYTAQITLSAASPAAKTDSEVSRAFEMAT